MSADKNHKEQFERYLAGKMSEEEAHAFERQALNDPFAQEALEGFEKHESEEVFSDIEKLQSQVLERKKAQFSLMNIAAAISLLVVSSFAVWFAVGSLEKDETLAMESEAEEQVEEPANRQNSAQFVNTDTTASNEDTKTLAEVTAKETQETKEGESTVAAEPIQIAEVEEAEVAVAEVITEAQEDASGADVASVETGVPLQSGASFAADEVAVVFEDNDEESEVSALQSTPLAADVSGKAVVAKEEKSKKDQQLGQGLVAEPTATNPEVAGLTDDLQESGTSEASELQVAQASQRRAAGVQLTESSSAAKRSANPSTPDVYVRAQPVSGDIEFKKYLDENVVYPESAKNNTIKGTVIIDLTISETGEIINFDVKRSLGHGCDEEAIRLVREGPGWNPALRNGVPELDKVRVRIRFKEN
ncbi:MAG: energy transducer TonB [Cyclobacteriaceae bacterium]